MSSRRFAKVLPAFAGILPAAMFVAGCQGQMRDQISYRAQESPLPVPASAVAQNDEEVNLDYPMEVTGGPANPYGNPSKAILTLGKRKYEAQCGSCHGLGGNGNGAVGSALLIPPYNLQQPMYKAMSEGQWYLRITNGHPFGPGIEPIMPKYQKKLTIKERWALVSYVKRELIK
ncbi:MAG: cytochrome c [Candidatus Sericytochromatia bacterium]|nr:cytochrome c [Candidatus Tanganyikabacteria bacterium]